MKQAKRNIDVISQHATEDTITDWNAPVKQANVLICPRIHHVKFML